MECWKTVGKHFMLGIGSSLWQLTIEFHGASPPLPRSVFYCNSLREFRVLCVVFTKKEK